MNQRQMGVEVPCKGRAQLFTLISKSTVRTIFHLCTEYGSEAKGYLDYLPFAQTTRLEILCISI